MTEYLTEEKLGLFLFDNFKRGEWIHDRSFITRSRPDYRNEFYKIIVEFDGDKHYTSAKRIVEDYKKDKIYSENGYNVIRIPYFIQLSREVISKVFGLEIDYEQTYSNGFIDKKCCLPCDFCELGIERFKNDLEGTYSFLKEEICNSLMVKIKELGNIDIVIPKSMRYLLNWNN